MGAYSPRHIAGLVLALPPDPNYQNLSSLVSEILRNMNSAFSLEQIAEETEKQVELVANELYISMDDDRKDDVISAFELNEDGNIYYYRRTANELIPYLRFLQQMDDTDFEKLCASILTKFGAQAKQIGGPSDGGIDFFCFDLRHGIGPVSIPLSSRVVVIGQAKRYKEGGLVKVTDIRDFIGSSIIRFDEIRKEFPQNVGLLTPISLAFWTTGSFHTNARDLCRETGIWYMNGWALSQIAKEFSLVTI